MIAKNHNSLITSKITTTLKTLGITIEIKYAKNGQSRL